MLRPATAFALLLLVSAFAIAGDEPAPAEEAKPIPPATEPADAPLEVEEPINDVEALVERAKRSVVEVSFTGRDGEQIGLGTGFVVDANGLIATNLHVIGEARPIRVKLADGTTHAVTSVHASQRTLDLALLKIDAKDLPALELGDSAAVKPGRRIVVLGNPRGLGGSVVEGVVSARREVDKMPMLQIAMPIEPGNSGGPVLDRKGRVLGVVTLKSLVTRNLGFAVEIDALKPLIAKPNPIPLESWLTIGRLDEEVWTTVGGANWRQRAGRISVSGRGGGFGGRSLCLFEQATPEVPFEVAVTVKLNDEEGAAGLVLHSDGGDKHYGFYPSNGQLRFSRFDGPDVFSWNVQHQFRTPHYRAGEWNTLKLRVEKDRVLAFVDGHQVAESRDRVYIEGKVGLAKFRETSAEFKRFRLATKIPSDRPSAEVVAKLDASVAEIDPTRPPSGELVDEVAGLEDAAAVHLRERALRLEEQAERLRQLAREAHTLRVRRAMIAELDKPDDERDLLRASLLLARLDNEELDVDAYLAVVDRIAADVRKSLPKQADAVKRLAALDARLFEQLGYHGSRTNYYHASNSYLNEVIDDREGLPITLAVLYLGVAKRLELPVVGVGLPGHFIVRFEPEGGDSQLIDVFEGGERLTRKEAAERALATSGVVLEDDHLRAQSDREIVGRMVQNLLGVARKQEDLEKMLTYVDLLVALDPASGQSRFFRAVLRFNTQRLDEAHADTTSILADAPDDVDLDRVRELHRVLEAARVE